MLIDMHNHTNVSSSCSVLSPEELIETARRMGLDAICVTEHLVIEGANITQEIGRKVGFPVFRGIEACSDLGDMLVFGYYKDIPDDIPLHDLCRYVHEAGGVVFAAHPYRTGAWSLYTALQCQGKNLDLDWDRLKVLKALDGAEVINGNIDYEKNKKAQELAGRLKIYGIGGSDAHFPDMIATAATEFTKLIQTDEALVEALKTGSYQAISLPYTFFNYF
ncbi:PHP domain-containing protein [Desulfonema magnum]|uniref:PHP domain-containing protein n=1 Tax=Desulfonema magnum TaxID=45655 RepID=A0A975BPT5_9BACT|nr:PHP domain-containing protein [Desulfonema magnum]QTA89133.1 PHP domain-containing protein [Desulfonema magnum]